MSDFNPYTDSSLIDYFDDTCAFAINADGSGGTPADGVECKSWAGKLGVLTANVTATLATLTGPTYKASLLGGRPGLVTDSTKGLSLGQPTAVLNFLNATNPTYTIIAVFKPTIAYTANPGLVLTNTSGGTTSGRLMLGAWASGGEPVAGNMNSLGLTGMPTPAGKFTVASIGGDAGTGRRGIQKMAVDGFGFYGSVGNGAASTGSDLCIGGQAIATGTHMQNSITGEMYAFFFFNRYLTPYEVKVSSDLIYSHYSQTQPDAALNNNIVYDCNSISTITQFPRAFAPLVAGHHVYNLGWGSKLGADQIAWLQQDAIALLRYLRPNGKRTITGVNEITNDMTGSATPETAVGNIERWMAETKPWSDKQFVVGTVDRSSTSFTRALLMRANGCLRVRYTSYADAMCDFAGTPLDAEDFAMSLYNAGDAVHPREPWLMDSFRANFAATLLPLLSPPTSAATSWRMSSPDNLSFARHSGGRTTGLFCLYPYQGTSASAVATIASSNASDVITSDDAGWSGSGNTGTMTWGSSGTGSWMGRTFRVKWGSTSGTRNLTAIVGGVTVATVSVTPIYTGALAVALCGPNVTGTNVRTRPAGVESPPFLALASTSAITGNANACGLASTGVSGTVTVTCSAGTVNLKSGSWTFDGTNSEAIFTVTPTPGTSSPVTLTVTNTITGSLSNPTTQSYYFDDSTPAITITAPPATAPRITNAVDSFMGTVVCTGLQTAQSRVVTPSDSLGRTISPATLTFGPGVTSLPFRLVAGSASGTHVISATSTGSGTYATPSTSSFVDAAGPFAGAVGFSAINPTDFTVTSPVPTGGTGPFTYQFRYAVDSSGLPGTWTNIGTATATRSATQTGLTAATKYYAECIVTDSASLTSTSTFYDFTTSNLVAGTTSVSSITSGGATATTTGGSNGYGTKTYQARIAPDVSGSPGTFANVGSAGAPLTKALTGLASSTAYWTQFGTIDSHPLAPGVAFDTAVTFTTSSGIAHVYSASILIMGQ